MIIWYSDGMGGNMERKYLLPVVLGVMVFSSCSAPNNPAVIVPPPSVLFSAAPGASQPGVCASQAPDIAAAQSAASLAPADDNATCLAIPASTSSVSGGATVELTTYSVAEKYYDAPDDFTELNLYLPKLIGNYAGIPKINEFFIDKMQSLYNKYNGVSCSGLGMATINYCSESDIRLEAKFGNIISILAGIEHDGSGNWHNVEANTFDLDTGEKLGLSDIFKVSEDEYMNFIYDFVSKTINDDINRMSPKENAYLFDDAYSGEGYKDIREFNPDDFCLSKDSLKIFYQKYTLSYGAADCSEFDIPYKSISDMLAIDVSKY